ncbi:MAG: tetratricopeptide repeat protein, partial [Anaerolineae bacterium]
SAQVYPLRLILLADAGRWQEVEALARSLLDEGNKDTRIPAHLTRSLLHQSQCEEATEVASTWYEQVPEDSEAQRVLGTLTRDPEILCPFQPDLCALVQDHAVAQSCAGNCDRALGEALLRRGDVALAGCVLQDAVAAQPQSAEAHAWLGEVLKRLGENEEARQHLLTATRIAPEKPLGWLLLGTLQLSAGEVEDAQQALFTAHRLDPANPATCLQLAAVFAAKGQYPEVAVWTQATLERAAEDVEVWKAVARFYLERNLEQEGQPLDAARGAARLAPQDSEAQMLLGWAYLAVGDTEQALVTLNEALSLSPEMAFAHHLRGQALTALGREEAAGEAFTRAADLGHLPR